MARRLLAVIVAMIAISAVHAERLPLTIYTSADGLGSSASFSLVRDYRGFIWLCSRDGLVRFDGYRFQTYRVGDEFADPAVYRVIPDRSGRYWINLNRGTDYRLLAHGDNEVLTPIPKEQATGDSRIPMQAAPVTDGPFPVFEDGDGTLWTGNNTGLLKMIERGDGGYDLEPIMPPQPGNPIDGLTHIVMERSADENGFWIGTHWGLVRRMRDGRMFHYSIKPENNQDLVRFVAEDKKGRIWIVRASSLIVLKTVSVPSDGPIANVISQIGPGKFAVDGTPVLPEAPGRGVEFSFNDLFRRYTPAVMSSPGFLRPDAYGVIAGQDDQIWLGTNHGLVRFDGSRFQHYTTANGLAANVIISLVEGAEGHIWLATYGGLHRLNPRGLATYEEADGFERTHVHSINETADGEMQVLTGNFNFAGLRGNSFIKVRPNIPADEVPNWQSNVGLLDSRGDWWVITNQRLYRFSGVQRLDDLNGRSPTKVYSEADGVLPGSSLRIFEDSGGNIWISTFVNSQRKVVTRIDRITGSVTHFETGDGLPNVATASAFVEDATGTIWVGFAEGGLGRYRDGKITMIESDSLPGGGITDLFRDSKGRVWVASARSGLRRVDDPSAERPTFVPYTTMEGLASNNVRCIGEDLLGRIYIGTVRGLDRLTPETGQIKYHGTSDGLASDFISVIHRDAAGTMWIGTLNGLSRLDPKENQPVQPVPVMISGLRIGDEDYSISPLGQTDVFIPDQEPGSNSMQIDFLTVGSSDIASTRYQYMLEGIDDDWSTPTEERSVTLANLTPGTHRFLVRSLVNGIVVSTRPAAVHFTVLRPVWQRWWFLLFVAVAMAAAAYTIYRYRLAQLLKLERVRTRIATDLHDDIGSSLSQIAILSEVARHKAGENGAAEPLRRIADTSRDLVDSMSDIVWAINPQKDHLSDLVQRMRRFAGDTFDATDVRYTFQFDDTARDVAVGADLRREVYLIFKECVNNTAKHSQATEVRISVSLSADRIAVEMSDDGVGFDVAEALSGEIKGYGGNGLLNMQRRAERLGGELRIESEGGKGTNISFTVPTSAPRAGRLVTHVEKPT